MCKLNHKKRRGGGEIRKGRVVIEEIRNLGVRDMEEFGILESGE